jgi:hypothetical protein
LYLGASQARLSQSTLFHAYTHGRINPPLSYFLLQVMKILDKKSHTVVAKALSIVAIAGTNASFSLENISIEQTVPLEVDTDTSRQTSFLSTSSSSLLHVLSLSRDV